MRSTLFTNAQVFDGTNLEVVPCEKPAGEVYELRAEIDLCVRMVRGQAAPAATGRDGLWSTALCLLAEESIRQRRALPVPNFA